MFIETRKQGKKKKYYLIHNYRYGNKVKRISRYLGSDLSIKKLEILRKRAEELILKQLNEDLFELSTEQLKYYVKYDKKIEIDHLQSIDWQQFTEVFTYNTNAIEGSTVAHPRVKEVIEGSKPNNLDEIEALNVAKAVYYIKKSRKLTVDFILKLHEICFKGTKPFAGKLRNVEVVIRNKDGKIIHTGAPYKEVHKLLHELCSWYEKCKSKYPSLYLAALLHNQFEKIHPFQDGNGRVGRLLLNFVLISKKYPPINIRLVDRIKYYRCLQLFDSKSDIKGMIRFLINQYKKYYG